jgi:energy-coupling factor transporter ATP-binding protein EcfA2
MITGMLFFEIAIREGLIPIHASAIGYQDEAILFSGPSRTGKSTQAELWKQNLDEVIFVNGDKPLLYETPRGLYVTGSPWSGKTAKNENVNLKVKTIIFIEQSAVNNLISLTVYDKITNFLRNVYRPREEAKIVNVLELIERMIYDLPVYRYYCTKDNDAFEYLYQALYRRDY